MKSGIVRVCAHTRCKRLSNVRAHTRGHAMRRTIAPKMSKFKRALKLAIVPEHLEGLRVLRRRRL